MWFPLWDEQGQVPAGWPPAGPAGVGVVVGSHGQRGLRALWEDLPAERQTCSVLCAWALGKVAAVRFFALRSESAFPDPGLERCLQCTWGEGYQRSCACVESTPVIGTVLGVPGGCAGGLLAPEVQHAGPGVQWGGGGSVPPSPPRIAQSCPVERAASPACSPGFMWRAAGLGPLAVRSAGAAREGRACAGPRK